MSPATCAILPPHGSFSPTSSGAVCEDSDSVRVLVATCEGLLYEFEVQGLRNTASGPQCAQAGQWSLLMEEKAE